jgi:hypothetical protein
MVYAGSNRGVYTNWISVNAPVMPSALINGRAPRLNGMYPRECKRRCIQSASVGYLCKDVSTTSPCKVQGDLSGRATTWAACRLTAVRVWGCTDHNVARAFRKRLH